MVEYINTPVTRLGNSSSTKGCLKYNRITNCITEIPQDIKLELNDGQLYMKGKAYCLDSTPISFEQNYSFSSITGPDSYYITIGSTAWSPNKISGDRFSISSRNIFTSETQPTTLLVDNNLWYKPSTKETFTTNNMGVTWIKTNTSLPICVVKVENGKVISIEHIFNGFGFVDTGVFVLPGVVTLGPKGFNDDGTLKNEISTTKEVYMDSSGITTVNYNYVLFKNAMYGRLNYIEVNNRDDLDSIAKAAFYYIRNENKMISWAGTSSTVKYEEPYTYIGTTERNSNGKIVNFNFKQSFQVLDYNNTSYIAHQSFPSNKSINLTLGISGANYVAPADGYFEFRKGASDGQYIKMTSTLESCINSSGYIISVFCPARKNDTMKLSYTASGTTYVFRFIYAEGED